MKKGLLIAGLVGLALTITACSEDEAGAGGDAGATTGGDDTGSADGDAGGGDDADEPMDAAEDTGGTTTGSDTIIAPPDTGEDEDTAQAGPPETCREAMLCRVRCGDDATCKDACDDGAEQAIADQIAAIETCLGTCQNAIEIQCLTDEEECYAELQACFVGGETGEDTCEETLECYAGCSQATVQDIFETFAQPPENPTCENACMRAADAEAQHDFLKYAFCVVGFCDDNDNVAGCQKSSGSACGALADQCITPQ